MKDICSRTNRVAGKVIRKRFKERYFYMGNARLLERCKEGFYKAGGQGVYQVGKKGVYQVGKKGVYESGRKGVYKSFV